MPGWPTKLKTGDRVGLLTLQRRAGRKNGHQTWWCRCQCGGKRRVDQGHLAQRKVDSCGCLNQQRRSAARRTHGMSKCPEYRIWGAMLQRCLNPKDRVYSSYGGRGITVCARWRRFENFIADMGKRPSPLHTLDRKNNDKGYSFQNCRWATRREQVLNTRRQQIISFQGKTFPLVDWACLLSVHPSTLRRRMYRGLPVDQVLKEYRT